MSLLVCKQFKILLFIYFKCVLKYSMTKQCVTKKSIQFHNCIDCKLVSIFIIIIN